jgi:ParB-like nuclease domain
MGRTIDPRIVAQVRPLVAKGYNGTQIAEALNLKEQDARWYAQQVRAEASATNSQGEDSTPPAVEITHVPLDAFALGDATQARARLDPAVIAEYAEAMTEGADFPAVVLFREGDLYWIGDGYHRIEAARKVGYKTIKAEVRPGATREALLYACGANTSHGLRRTNADKRKAVDTLLQDEEWGQWSNYQIAKHCGVSDEMVRGRRDSLPTMGSDGGRRTYVTKHGSVATMDTSRIGTRAEPPAPMDGAPAEDRQAPTPPVMAPEAATAPMHGGAPEAPHVSLVPASAPEADDAQEAAGDETAEEYRAYFSAWIGLLHMYAKWAVNIRSGNDARDRQFPQEVVRRAGEAILTHIEALQDTAAGLQAFAAVLQRAAEAEDTAGADKPA